MAGRFSLEAIFKAIDQFSAPMAKMEARFEAATKRFSRGLGNIDKFNSKVSEGLGRAAVAGAGAGLVFGAVAQNVIGAGAEFDKAITAVAAVSLETRKDIEPLEKEARRLGSTMDGFGFTATQVAGAMELLGKAGFDNNETLQATPGLLAAAAAEGADLAEVAGLVSNTLKGMGMATSETTRVADVLTLASARTNSSISSLGESMAIASSTAKQFKIPFEQVVASVALLQDVGLDASTAGTAVSTMLTKLAAPSSKARAEMQALGITFEDANHNMLPLPQIFEQFGKAAKKSGGDMRSVAFFAELVGLRGEKAALNLKDLFTSGKFSKLTEELEGAQGSAAKMARIRMDTFSGDLTMLGKTADDLKISLFDMNVGGLRGVVQGMTQWISSNKELIKTRIQDTIVAIVTHLPEIYLWSKRIFAAVVFFYAWQLAVKAAAAATVLWEIAMGAAGIAAGALGFVIGVLAMEQEAATVAAILGVAWTWIQNAALFAYNAVVWLGVAAIAAYSLATGEWTVQSILSNAIMGTLRIAFIAYNAVVAAGATIIDIYNAGGLLAVARLAAWTVASWAATAAQTALNFAMSINPAFLVGAGLLVLFGIVMKLSGAWDWLKDKVAGFGDSVMAKIQPVIDKITALWAAIKKAGSLVGGFLGMGGAVPGETPEGMVRAPPPDQQGPIMSPTDGVTKSIEESNFVSRGEVTIKDESGRAEITKPTGGPGFSLNLQPSGAF